MSFIERLKLAWRIIMGKDLHKGNWFENQEEIANKVESLSDDGGTFKGLISGKGVSYLTDGAIDTNYSVVALKSSAETTDMTLAITSQIQYMTIYALNYSNSMTVTADFGGAITTATFSAAGEAIHLMCDTNAWYVIGNNGVVLS
jgi:hypothetical protein